MKTGTKVYLYEDGKMCRLSEGVVTATKNGYKIQVKFQYNGTELTAWFRKGKCRRNTKKDWEWLKKNNFKNNSRHNTFEGWVNTDPEYPDWYNWFHVRKTPFN